MRESDAGWRSRGYLPHYDAAQTVQHIVFCLADALPKNVQDQMRRAPQREYLEMTEAPLDAGSGGRLLADPRAAAIVQASLLHFDGVRYRLFA